MYRLMGIAAAALVAVATAHAADKLPALSTSHAVSIVSSGAPGSSNDRAGRTFGQIAEKYTEQKFVVENRVGAGGYNAINYLMNQPADGMTIYAWTKSAAIVHLTHPGAVNLVESLHFIGITMYAPFVIYTYAEGSPYPDAKSMFDDCKAHPGEQKWAGSPAGFIDWLMMQIVWKATGCPGQYIPYDDGAAQVAAVMGKQVAISGGDMGDIVSRTDLLKPLAIASPERDSRLPDVPTLKELGYDVVEQQHRGLAMRKEVPDNVKEFYKKLYEAVMADPDWAKYIVDQQAVVGGGGSEEMEKTVRQTETYGKQILKDAGIIQ
ncbi:tripartite tricarboxylate transporter substrate binding protein [soil metagenome]